MYILIFDLSKTPTCYRKGQRIKGHERNWFIDTEMEKKNQFRFSEKGKTLFDCGQHCLSNHNLTFCFTMPTFNDPLKKAYSKYCGQR